jgi:hypothetical protein
MIQLPLKAFTGNGMIIERKAQSAVWGLLSILVLVVIAGGCGYLQAVCGT